MIGGEHMKTRRLGKTGLMVSEIGFGGEWLERHTETEGIELIRYASEKGINMLDCWMADPKSRNIIGEGMKENRDQWFIQGHIGSTWKDGQYFRTREMKYVRPAFEDLLKRLQTDYIDLGMIHYVDSEEEWEKIQHSDYLDYVMELKEKGVIRHIGMSSHNPKVAMKAVESGYIEMILSVSTRRLICCRRVRISIRCLRRSLTRDLRGSIWTGRCSIRPVRRTMWGSRS